MGGRWRYSRAMDWHARIWREREEMRDFLQQIGLALAVQRARRSAPAQVK